MRNSNIHRDRTPAKAGDYVSDFRGEGFYVQNRRRLNRNQVQ